MAGTAVNVPFDLQVKKVKSQKPGDKRLYPVVSLIPNVGADKIDEVNQFLEQGNSLRDIKKFLRGDSSLEAAKTLPTNQQLQIKNKITVKAELFDSNKI
jgi:hypothetical protein